MINPSDMLCFAAQNKSKSILQKSSSGGAFYILAKHFFDIGGYVCGATFDSQGNVFHIVSNDPAQLERMLTSKYVRSDLKNCFPRIKELLEKGEWVLFCGTPCQAAALSFFLRGFAAEHLLIVDLICHGTPAPKYWKSFLEANHISDISSLNFRKKRPSWEHYSLEINSSLLSKQISGCYMNLFLRNYILTPSCYKCRYKGFNRYSDITLCDFWGHNKSISNLKKRGGISGVILNTKTGRKYIELLKKDAYLYPCSLFDIVRNNKSYFDSASVPNDRDAIISNIDWSQNRFEKPHAINGLNKIKNFSVKTAKLLLIDHKKERTIHCKGLKQKNTIIIVTNDLEKSSFDQVLEMYSLKMFFENRGFRVKVLIPLPPARNSIAKLIMVLGLHFTAKIKRIANREIFNKGLPNKCESLGISHFYFSYLKSDKKKLNESKIILFYGDIWNFGYTQSRNIWAGNFGLLNEHYKKVAFAIVSRNSLVQQKFNEVFAGSLKSFSAISFEKNDSNDSHNGVTVLDPIFLSSGSEWDSFLKKYVKIFPNVSNPFVLVFCDGNGENYNKVKDYYLKNDFNVIDLSGSDAKHFSSKTLNLINYVRCAKIVVTDSYIIVALAILYGKRIHLCHAVGASSSFNTTKIKSLFSIIGVDANDVEGSVFDASYFTKESKFIELRQKTIAFLDSCLKDFRN